MEAAEQILPTPNMSPAKQDRIRIWRDEVATAHLDPDDDASTAPSRAGGAAGSSATSTTTSSSSSRSALVVARGRHLLSRLAHRLSLRSSSPSPSPPDGHGNDSPPSHFWSRRRRGADDRSPNGVTRTAMYAALSPDNAAAWAEEGSGEVAPGQDASADGAPPRDAAIREKQDRLLRAARLLEKNHAVQM